MFLYSPVSASAPCFVRSTALLASSSALLTSATVPPAPVARPPSAALWMMLVSRSIAAASSGSNNDRSSLLMFSRASARNLIASPASSQLSVPPLMTSSSCAPLALLSRSTTFFTLSIKPSGSCCSKDAFAWSRSSLSPSIAMSVPLAKLSPKFSPPSADRVMSLRSSLSASASARSNPSTPTRSRSSPASFTSRIFVRKDSNESFSPAAPLEISRSLSSSCSASFFAISACALMSSMVLSSIPMNLPIESTCASEIRPYPQVIALIFSSSDWESNQSLSSLVFLSTRLIHHFICIPRIPYCAPKETMEA